MPGRHLPVERVAAIVVVDVGAEEGPDARPAATAEQPSADRQDQTRVGAPGPPPRYGARDVELEARDRAAGTYDPGELTQCRRGVGHVAQQVGEGQRVEHAVVERQRLAAAEDQRDAALETRLGDPLTTDGQHVGRDVDADDPCVAACRELQRYPGGAGGDVGDRRRSVTQRGVDHHATPAGVLAEREHLGETVVALGQRREDRTRPFGRARRDRRSSGHGCLLGVGDGTR